MDIKVEKKYTIEVDSAEFSTILHGLKKAKLKYHEECIAYQKVSVLIKKLEESK